MKVIATIDELMNAMAETARGTMTVGDYVRALYDALPDAPLPDEVAAVISRMKQKFTSGNNIAVQLARITDEEWNTILRALTASVADVQRLREALEQVRTTGFAHPQKGDDGCYTCDALAVTPATGLVVVDGDELAALRAMKERVGSYAVAIHNRAYPDSQDQQDATAILAIITGEATDEG